MLPKSWESSKVKQRQGLRVTIREQRTDQCTQSWFSENSPYCPRRCQPAALETWAVSPHGHCSPGKGEMVGNWVKSNSVPSQASDISLSLSVPLVAIRFERFGKNDPESCCQLYWQIRALLQGWRFGIPTLPFFGSVTHRQTLLAIHSFTCHRSIQTLCFFLSQVWELYIFPGICPLLSKLTSMLA